MKSDSKPKPEVVTLDDSVMINETGDISVPEVAHEEIVGDELPGIFFKYSKALRCTFFGERKNSFSSKFGQLLLLNRV